MTQSDEVVSESRWSRVLFRIGVGSAIVLSASLVPLIGSGWAGRIKPAVAADDALAIPVQTTGFSLRTSRQILVVFMGSSTCGASTRPELKGAMRKLADRLRADTKVDPRLQLMFIGVATDWEFDKGLRFLADYGAFDEVIVGGNWLNSAAVRFIWRDLPGQPAFPQVVLLEREVTVNKTNVTFGPEKVISRFIGIDEIIERVDSEQKLLPRRTTTF